MNRNKLLVAGMIVALAASYLVFDLGQYLSLDVLKASRDSLWRLYVMHPVAATLSFGLAYIGVSLLALPGTWLMSIAAGAIFGFWIGTVVVSFASALGATLAFLAARYLFRETIQRKYGSRLERVNAGMEREGPYYLFSLRLVPLIPFPLINVLLGLTAMRTWTFYWVSQAGMLAGTSVYVNAGTQLAQLQSTSDLLSVELVGAFVLLAIFPWLARAALGLVRRRAVYKGWRRPARFDRNLIVIGAGSAGLVTAYIAAALKAEVTLIERHRMGGDCLNTGCVPSKTLLRSAKVLNLTRKLPEYGLSPANVAADFRAVMRRVHGVIGRIAPHDSVERYAGLGVDCRIGAARLVSPWEVEIVSGERIERLSARSIVIASGAAPAIPPIPGLDQIDYLTSDSLWGLEERPDRLVVLGAGPIGCELAQAFARLGSAVTLVEMLPRLLPREDPDASALVERSLAADGVRVMPGSKAERFIRNGGENAICVVREGKEERVVFDRVLIAVGRRANTRGLELDTLGIPVRRDGTIETDEYLQTRYSNIYACGDVTGPHQFTHMAGHQAWYAAVNALFGRFWKFRVDYSAVPWATFTDPEVARVGLSETEAREQGTAFEVARFGFDELDRAIADGTDQGFVKVVTAGGSDRILGACIVGEHAGDLLAPYVLAMKHGIGLNKILGTIHVYPTLSEAVKHAAGVWRRAHQPAWAMARLPWLHARLRGT
ncbi:MAG: FAD-dependent oxidoreductase [Gammaproteobacteria bacterium]|nr:FAD-dependent oxidoreductase [Gammaproteobacteria bacterium]